MNISAIAQLQRDALGRLSRLHGEHELHAAVLALIVPRESMASIDAWEQEISALGTSDTIGADVACLTDSARLPCLEALLDRMRALPTAQRRTLLQAVRRVMAAQSPLRPLDRLHWLLMRRKLSDELPVLAPEPETHGELAELPQSSLDRIASVTAYLARMVPTGDAAAGREWYAQALGSAADSLRVPPCVAPDGDGLARALVEVEALPWTLRPVLVRAWVEAALSTSQRARLLPMAADALRLAAGLLNSPLPPELARHYDELDW